jgi:(R)-citramalyl-CoA lyase
MLPDQVIITDVAPRDGLQNEPEILPVAARIALVEQLLAAGVPRVEVGSFVNPKQVPQMAGAGEVVRELLKHQEAATRSRAPGAENRAGDEPGETQVPGARLAVLTALVPNMRGYELAVEAGLRHVRLVLAASEALNQANFRRPVAESLAEFATIAARAQADGVGFGVAIGAAFGCPFEGRVPPERVLAIARALAALGADEVVLADTTGMAVPTQVEALCRAALAALQGDRPPPAKWPEDDGRKTHAGLPVRGERDGVQTRVCPPATVHHPTLGVHFHNTRNTGYANAYAALRAGVAHFDAALGGIGGCPFAPRAVGNIATEDFVHMLNGMGIASGVRLGALLDAARWLGEQMGRPLPALVGRAEPVFPVRHTEPSEAV